MIPAETIRRKRDGHALPPAEIAAFAAGLTCGQVSDAQAAAFAMAVFLRGMTPEETTALTLAMRDSGAVLDWRALGIDGPVLDKHSTGGVGDKVSLILAPLLAACGAYVPMISGRGLGHTGGTLDKMDAIPGYRSQPAREDFAHAVLSAGCAIAGATDDLAPADRRLYAVRDVTGTVESLPLITASILSKKLAAGLGGLVLDVKLGSGAFMQTEPAARALAESLVRVAGAAGLPAVALLTGMDQALGRSAGNALEVREAIAFLTGAHRDPRLAEVTLALAEEALVLGNLAENPERAQKMAQAALGDGSAAERFARSVAALGGPADLLERPHSHLRPAPVLHAVHAEAAGLVGAIDARALGLAIIELGGGRRRAEDGIDHRVGLSEVAGIGEAVDAARPLCVVHAASEDAAAAAALRIRAAMRVGESPPPAAAVRGRVTAGQPAR